MSQTAAVLMASLMPGVAAHAPGPSVAALSPQAILPTDQGIPNAQTPLAPAPRPASIDMSRQLGDQFALPNLVPLPSNALPQVVSSFVHEPGQPDAATRFTAPDPAGTTADGIRAAISIKQPSATGATHPIAGLLLQVERLQSVPQNDPASAASSPLPHSASDGISVQSGGASSADLPLFPAGAISASDIDSSAVNQRTQPSSAAAPLVVAPTANPATPHTGSRSSSEHQTDADASNESATIDPHGPAVSPARASAPDFLAQLATARAKTDSSTGADPGPPVPHGSAVAAPSSFSAAPATPPAAATASPSTAHGFDVDNATPGVNPAQLATALAKSEMHIALQTEKLGAVELHAHVAGDLVGASISVEKRDAHALLAVELPALHQALADKNLSVQQISLTQGSPHTAAGHSGNPGGSSRQNNYASHSSPAQNRWTPQAAAALVSRAAPDSHGIFDTRGRLSVRV